MTSRGERALGRVRRQRTVLGGLVRAEVTCVAVGLLSHAVAARLQLILVVGKVLVEVESLSVESCETKSKREKGLESGHGDTKR